MKVSQATLTSAILLKHELEKAAQRCDSMVFGMERDADFITFHTHALRSRLDAAHAHLLEIEHALDPEESLLPSERYKGNTRPVGGTS